MAESPRSKSHAIPLLYRIFFPYIEPLAALAGAYYAFNEPQEYLRLTHASSAPQGSIPVSTTIILNQLSNLYLLFAVNEALVLRTSSDINVWRSLLFGLLIADLGHLYSVHPLGFDVYWNVLRWNAIDWGNVAFVYVGATMRFCFLGGLGMSRQSPLRRSKRRTKRS